MTLPEYFLWKITCEGEQEGLICIFAEAKIDRVISMFINPGIAMDILDPLVHQPIDGPL